MTPLKSGKLGFGGLAWPAPLLKLTLPGRTGGTPAPYARGALGMMHHLMLVQDILLCADRSGLGLWTVASEPEEKAWCRWLGTSFALTQLAAYAQQMLLPTPDGLASECKQNPLPRVLLMHGNAIRGG